MIHLLVAMFISVIKFININPVLKIGFIENNHPTLPLQVQAQETSLISLIGKQDAQHHKIYKRMSNEEWMTSLSWNVRNTPIINLAIPGSHNSMMYGITSKIGPDADAITRRLNYIFPFLVKRWAKTQSATVLQQLQLGVRYFDLRICQKDNVFYYVHGLYAMEVFEPLYELKQFLIQHPKEVCILDFQHFYSLNVTNHMELHQRLLDLFGQMFFSTTDGDLTDCTLNRCAELQKQIILIYRRCPISLPAEFWPSFSWPTPWPNVASLQRLEEFLDSSLKSRKSSQGFVSQCVITPTGRYIAMRFFSSLRRVAKRVDQKIQPWICEQSPGPFQNEPTVNVFLADYVNLNDGQFCNCVIQLNTKLDESKANGFTEAIGDHEKTG